MMNSRWFLPFILLHSIPALAQKGEVQFRIAPTDAVIKVGEQYIESLGTYEFEAGTYTVRAWKPQHEYVEMEFIVREGEKTYVTFGLLETDAYKQHKNDLFTFHTSVFGLRYVTTGLYALYVANGYASLNALSENIDRLRNIALDQKNTHDAAVVPAEIDEAASSYGVFRALHDQQLELYDKRRKRLIVTSSIGGSILIGCHLFSLQLKKPVFDEEVKLSLRSSYQGGIAGLTMQFKF